MKRLTITHPAYLAAKHSKREHERFNAGVQAVDPNYHHNTVRMVIKNQDNAERIAAMMAHAEGVHDA